jgi:SAM-dependent methyltransferase/methyltransferase-like protein
MAMPPLDYESLPYRSMPFPQTQPAHLAALAVLQGHEAPPVATARVLELGCASGANLVPLAARCPEAVFEGVDLSPRHVDEAQALVRALGLRNVAFRQGDIAALDLAGREFDYIVCHGVFSWVPPAVQEAVFRLCAAHLSPQGVAYVSYNVLPGWRLSLIVRDLCRPFAVAGVPPQQQIARARAALEQAARAVEDGSAFGRALRDEVQRSARMDDTHFQGEYLAADNDPCHFHEFTARAATHGLAYLGDAGAGDPLPETLGPERAAAVGAFATGSGLSPAQAMDFATGRIFRRSMLVRAAAVGAGAPGVPAPGADALARLHGACALQPAGSTGGAFVFRHDATQIQTNDPVVASVLRQLGAAYPDTLGFAEMTAQAAAETGQRPEQFGERLVQAVRRTIESGHLRVSTQPVRVGREDDPQPALWPIAAAQLALGQDWVTSLWHAPVRLPPAARLVAQQLDGTRTVQALKAQLAAAITRGEIVVEGVATGDVSAAAAAAERLLTSVLREFRRSGLLSPPG